MQRHQSDVQFSRRLAQRYPQRSDSRVNASHLNVVDDVTFARVQRPFVARTCYSTRSSDLRAPVLCLLFAPVVAFAFLLVVGQADVRGSSGRQGRVNILCSRSWRCQRPLCSTIMLTKQDGTVGLTWMLSRSMKLSWKRRAVRKDRHNPAMLWAVFYHCVSILTECWRVLPRIGPGAFRA